jgi:hypothetical protein
MLSKSRLRAQRSGLLGHTERAKHDKWERVSDEKFQYAADNLQHSAKEIGETDRCSSTAASSSPAHECYAQGRCSNQEAEQWTAIKWVSFVNVSNASNIFLQRGGVAKGTSQVAMYSVLRLEIQLLEHLL